jgi:hypothetical protein
MDFILSNPPFEVNMKQTTRQTYDLLDMIRVARRFKSENNYMVLPDDIA